MLALKDIRNYISGSGIADDDRVYIGKLDNKKEKAIGIYPRGTSGQPIVPLGGYENGSYGIKPISILVHWTKSKDETERAACRVFEHFKMEKCFKIGSTTIQFIRLMVPEPQDVGTDDNGIYEYVIWLDFIYSKEGNT